MPYRCTAVRFFLTIPQCEVMKEVVVAKAQQEWGNSLLWIVVGRELHQDGQPHLHVALCFGAKKNFTNPLWADFLTGKHGNYQTMRNMRKCLEYVTKDKDFLEVGIVVATVLAKQSSKSAMIEAALQEGKTIAEVRESYPGYVLRNLKMMEYYMDWMQRMSIRSKEVCWDPVHAADAVASNVLIAEWLNANILRERTFKQPQLWIWGGPNLGKSSLAEWLAQQLRVYFLPLDEGYYDMWDDEAYDLVVIDEYKAQKKMTWLNQFLQGSTMSVAVKGSQRMKKRNLPILILSNFTPTGCYWRAPAESLAPLMTRLTVVEVTEFIKIESQ